MGWVSHPCTSPLFRRFDRPGDAPARVLKSRYLLWRRPLHGVDRKAFLLPVVSFPDVQETLHERLVPR